MNWRSRLDGVSKVLLVGCLIGGPLFWMEQGETFWSAVGITVAMLGLLGGAIYMIYAIIGVPVGLIAKSVVAPRPPQKQGRIWAWVLIVGECACVVWGYTTSDGGKLALGLGAMVFGAGILTGAWSNR